MGTLATLAWPRLPPAPGWSGLRPERLSVAPSATGLDPSGRVPSCRAGGPETLAGCPGSSLQGGGALAPGGAGVRDTEPAAGWETPSQLRPAAENEGEAGAGLPCAPTPTACPAACGRVVPLAEGPEPARGPAGPGGPAQKGELVSFLAPTLQPRKTWWGLGGSAGPVVLWGIVLHSSPRPGGSTRPQPGQGPALAGRRHQPLGLCLLIRDFRA